MRLRAGIAIAGTTALELKGYARVDLKPYETKTVTVTASSRQLARHDNAGTLTIKPEKYLSLVGASLTDNLLGANLDLAGSKIILPHREQFFGGTTVQ